MPKIVRTSDARNDLRDIARYIMSESKSRTIALDFLDKIDEKCELYATQPLMATARDDLGNQVHTFVVDSYVVVYQPIKDGLRILEHFQNSYSRIQARRASE